MDGIFNHDLGRAVAPEQRHTGRARVQRADASGWQTSSQAANASASGLHRDGIQNAAEGKDPFCDFPLRQRKHYSEHPALKGELAQGLQAPQVDLAGGDIVGQHRTPLKNMAPASGVPNYPGRGGDAWKPHEMPQPQPASSSAWQTTAQAQMAGESADHKKRGGKKMVHYPGRDGGAAGGSGSLTGYHGPHGGNTGGIMFAANTRAARELQGRVDPLHNQVDPRGALALETLPFVPGYGGHVPVSHDNLSVAVQKGLKPRMNKDLLVENFSNKMSGCTKVIR